jgi:hypothetical protein
MRWRQQFGPVAIIAIVAVMVVAACGGTVPGTSSNPGAPGSTTSAGGNGGTGGGGSTPAPGGSATAQDDPCTFLTGSEATGALHSLPLTAMPGQVPADCIYVPAGDTVGAVVLETLRAEHPQTAFDQWKGEGSEAVPGVGDAAAVDGTEFTLLVGNLLIHIRVRWGTNDADHASAILIGKIIASRLTTGSVPPELQVTPPPTVKAQHACDLISAAEATAVLHIDGLEAAKNENLKAFCYYTVTATGEVVATVYFDGLGGQPAWDSMVGTLDAVAEDGVADQARWDEFGTTLYFLKGDAMMDVAVSRFDVDGKTALDIARELAKVMLGHL